MHIGFGSKYAINVKFRSIAKPKHAIHPAIESYQVNATQTLQLQRTVNLYSFLHTLIFVRSLALSRKKKSVRIEWHRDIQLFTVSIATATKTRNIRNSKTVAKMRSLTKNDRLFVLVLYQVVVSYYLSLSSWLQGIGVLRWSDMVKCSGLFCNFKLE